MAANDLSNNNLGIITTLVAASTGGTGRNLDTSRCSGLLVFVNITAISGAGATLTVTIKGVSPQGVDYNILVSAGLVATGQTVLRVYPSMAAVANVTAQDIVPVTTHIDWAIAGTTPSVTATIAVETLY